MMRGYEHLPALLASADLQGEFTVSDLPGGGNNKVYRIDIGETAALLKVYFRDEVDTRDRLGAEFSFCRFAWSAGVRSVPQPLAQDPAAGLGLYEFLQGRPLRNGEVDRPAVEQAVEFFCELNRHKSLPEAQSLRPGSEACFTMAEHLDCVDRRMKRFDQLDRTTPTGEEADALVHERLIPAWSRIREQVVAGGVALDEPLPPGDRCLSPSDFGFHNTIATAQASDSLPASSLPSPGTPAFGSEAQARRGEGQGGGLEGSSSKAARHSEMKPPPPQPSPGVPGEGVNQAPTEWEGGVPGEGEKGGIVTREVSPGALRVPEASGRLKFIDFEYSGWDDPAKTVCDFFCQPDVTVPMEFFEPVSRAFVEDSSDPAAHLRRIALLLPVYRVKWCCILLNEFLPVGSRRRSFAKDPASQEQRRAAQLHKVRRALEGLQ
jgi:hypothetical protein